MQMMTIVRLSPTFMSLAPVVTRIATLHRACFCAKHSVLCTLQLTLLTSINQTKLTQESFEESLEKVCLYLRRRKFLNSTELDKNQYVSLIILLLFVDMCVIKEEVPAKSYHHE